jgi:hypothetical protein
MAKNAEKTGQKFANLAQITAEVRREEKKLAPAGQIAFSGHSQQNK